MIHVRLVRTPSKLNIQVVCYINKEEYYTYQSMNASFKSLFKNIELNEQLLAASSLLINASLSARIV